MGKRRDIEESSRSQFDYFPVIHRRDGSPQHDHPDMPALAARRPPTRLEISGPFPSGLINPPADGHPADSDNLESPFFKSSNLIRLFKPLQNGFQHGCTSRIA